MNCLRFSVRFLLVLTLVCALVVVAWPRKPIPKSEIVKQLESRNRNAVHVALWTLQKNDIEIPDGIDLRSPYMNSERLLSSLIDELASLDVSDLKKLDESLGEHWLIYSPIWGPTSQNWE